jgi:transcriptional regulator with XRE-family HTH domain
MNAKLTGPACRAARALLAWTVPDLIRAAGVSPNTVNKVETGGAVRPETEAKLIAAFAAHGVEITNGNGTGARLLKPQCGDD